MQRAPCVYTQPRKGRNTACAVYCACGGPVRVPYAATECQTAACAAVPVRRRQHQSIYGAVNGRLRARPPEWALEREGGFGTYRAHLPNARIPGHRLQSFLQWRKGAGGLHHDGPR